MDPERDAYHLGVIEAIASNDVISLFFPYAMRSWIIDMRHSLLSPPMLVVDGMVASPEARMQSFRRLRPEMPGPDELTVIPWIGHVRQLETTGVLAAIFVRCKQTGMAGLDAHVSRCYDELVQAETKVKRQIILGVGMQPLWRRPQG